MIKKRLIYTLWMAAIIVVTWPKLETGKAQDGGTPLNGFRQHIHPIYDCFHYDDWYDYHPIWSPDSQKLIFNDYCPSSFHWKVYDATQKQLYDDENFPLLSYHSVTDALKATYGIADGFEAYTRYSPDGHYMVYVSNVMVDVVIEGLFSAHLVAIADLHASESRTIDFIVEPFTSATDFDVIWSEDGTAFSMNSYAWSYPASYVLVNGYTEALANVQLQAMNSFQLPNRDYVVCRIFESSSDGEQWLLDVGPVIEGIYPCETENRQVMIFDAKDPASSAVIETRAAAARFSEDDNKLLAITAEGLVMIDITSAQSQVINADLDISWINWGWFSPDGQWLAFAQSRPEEYVSNLYVVDGRTGLPTILANMPPPTDLTPITPENAILLQPIAIYSDPSRAEFSNINACSYRHVILSPDGKWLVSIGYNTICALDISQLNSEWRIFPIPETTYEIVGWAIRPNSQELAYVSANKINDETRYAVYIVNLTSEAQRTLVENQEKELRIVLSPDNTTAAIYTFDNPDTQIDFIAIDTGLTIGTVSIKAQYTSGINIAFNRTGSQLMVFDYSIDLNPQLQLIDMKTLAISQISQYKGHGTLLLSLGPDLYFAGLFGASGQWVTDLPFVPNLQPIRDLLWGDASGKWDGLVISADGTLLVAKVFDYGGVLLWDTRTGSQLTILADGGWQSNLAFSGDSRYLLTDTYGGIQLWGIPSDSLAE